MIAARCTRYRVIKVLINSTNINPCHTASVTRCHSATLFHNPPRGTSNRHAGVVLEQSESVIAAGGVVEAGARGSYCAAAAVQVDSLSHLVSSSCSSSSFTSAAHHVPTDPASSADTTILLQRACTTSSQLNHARAKHADFLRLSRSTIDDTISTQLNALLTPSTTNPFTRSSTTTSNPNPRPSTRPIPRPSCDAFKTQVLFPTWSARSSILAYCGQVASAPDPADPTRALRERESRPIGTSRG
ncbi:hypothetical protein GJ744_001656 [Endocarpon pusillum]|uniref:Uncharacterized protein n=1 Tax=Endocarpon pusillum TaxID=364733 RepID=A0A8H7A983_9EURO|nr:hypothetical protein GJ744_001656 [Endocarpon pusillum]